MKTAVKISERTKLEMERGQRAVARAANLAKIESLNQARLLRIRVVSDGNPPVYDFIIGGVPCYRYEGELAGSEYPSLGLMAAIGLAVHALDLTVPKPIPTHKVSEEGREYREQLRKMNAWRWGEQ